MGNLVLFRLWFQFTLPFSQMEIWYWRNRRFLNEITGDKKSLQAEAFLCMSISLLIPSSYTNLQYLTHVHEIWLTLVLEADQKYWLLYTFPNPSVTFFDHRTLFIQIYNLCQTWHIYMCVLKFCAQNRLFYNFSRPPLI